MRGLGDPDAFPGHRSRRPPRGHGARAARLPRRPDQAGRAAGGPGAATRCSTCGPPRTTRSTACPAPTRSASRLDCQTRRPRWERMKGNDDCARLEAALRLHAVIDSPIGPLTLVTEGGKLTGLYMEVSRATSRTRPRSASESASADDEVLVTGRQPARCLLRRRADRASTCRSSWTAPASSARCGPACSEIPYGETISYGELAKQDRPAVGVAGGRPGQRPESGLDRGALPSGRRRERQPDRLRRRTCTASGSCSHSSSGSPARRWPDPGPAWTERGSGPVSLNSLIHGVWRFICRLTRYRGLLVQHGRTSGLRRAWRRHGIWIHGDGRRRRHGVQRRSSAGTGSSANFALSRPAPAR